MRASRLVSAVLLLQARGRMTADALAAELGVSVRTVYRDIDSLHRAGVPVYGEAGRDGGYRLVEGYRTQLTGLTSDEAAALWLLALPGPAAELGLGGAASGAAAKLKAALRDETRGRADAVQQRVHVDLPGWYSAPDDTPFLAEVADAVFTQRRLAVRYHRWKAPQDVDRTLEPIGLVLKAGGWYLVARSRGRLRTYRVSQLLDARRVDEHFDRPAGFDLAAYWTAYLADFAARRHRERATVRVSPAGLERLRAMVDPAVTVDVTGSEGDGWLLATVPIESVGYAHDQMLRLGADVEVLAPAALRERLAGTAVSLARFYA
jgi:predicted DNA-binding transcriptional regulator YafY